MLSDAIRLSEKSPRHLAFKIVLYIKRRLDPERLVIGSLVIN